MMLSLESGGRYENWPDMSLQLRLRARLRSISIWPRLVGGRIMKILLWLVVVIFLIGVLVISGVLKLIF